ncbi:MAG: cytochrome c biogenesis protein CcdA [bacterium]
MRFPLSLFLLLLSFPPLHAQVGTDDVLAVEAFLSVDRIRPGDVFKLGLKTTLFGNWHINSNHPSEEFLIPTELTLDPVAGLTFGEVHYPEGELKDFEFSETPLSVYEGELLLWLEVKASQSLTPGDIRMTGRLKYQACNDVSCLIPTHEPFDLTVEVAPAGAEVRMLNQAQFNASAAALGELQGERADNEVGALISESGLFLTLFFIFVGGLALNLTPCVYPIIPITISFFVGQASGKVSKSFFLALIYVLGLSLTYSLLGVMAAMTGGLLGSSLQNPLVLVAIAAVFLIFAASMFGAFEIRVPAFLNTLAGGSRQGVAGSLFMGLTVGIVAAPCIGPFVLSLLTYVAAQGDPVMGFLLFFVLSLGLGLPYLVLGTFSGSLKNLPRSGEWMVWVKKVFGVIMVAVALYFVNTLLPETTYVGLLTATAIVGGVFVGFLDKSTASFKGFRIIKRSIGAALVVFGVWFSASAWAESNAPHIDWQPYSEALVSQAKASGQPILIDFYADWCIPCKRIDKQLFRHPVVVESSGRFMALKADLTTEENEFVINLREQYGVRGVPTIILIDESGREYKRFTDELVDMAPEAFVRIMQGAIASR